MSKVDNRTVELGFENRDFEKGIRDSSRSLADFDKALRNSGNGSAFSGLSGIVDGVTGKFSAFGTIAVGALMRIGSQAVAVGQQLIHAIAIEPITAGFSEYELKINSIKTMLASGKTAEGLPVTLEQVNKELEVLNLYADQTIYSFSDMTSNIGKFTNAGVDLETSVQAIKGIANAAALSGANSAEASRAMYNFSQALSAGYVKLIDWKSIENANMATVEFKTQLLESAVAAGTLEKQADGMYKVLASGRIISATKEFNDSLQEQWMTTEALTKTLNDYADETTEIGKKATEAATKVRTWSQLMDTTKEALQSGWGVSFETIFGDYNEATEIFTGLSDVIGDIVENMSDARNSLLKDWKELGGRTSIIEGITAAWDALSTTISWIKEAFTNVFPPLTGEKLAQLSQGFKNFMVSLKPTTGTLIKLKVIFTGVFNAISLGFKIVSSIFKGLSTGISKVVSLIATGENGGLLGFFVKIAQFFTNLNESADKSKIFIDISTKIGDAFTFIGDKIRAVIDIFKESEFITTAIDAIKTSLNGFPNKFKGFDGFIERVKTFFVPLIGILKPVGDFLVRMFDKIKTALAEKWKTDGFSGLLEIITTALKGGVLIGLKNLISSFTGLTDNARGITSGLKGIFGGLESTLKSYQESLQAKKLQSIAIAIGILAASIVALSLIDPERMGGAVSAITMLFVELVGAFAIMNKAMSGGPIAKVGGQLLALSASVLLISFALKSIASVPADRLKASVVALGAVFTELVIFSKLMQNTKSFMGAAAALVAIGVGINIIVLAMRSLGNMDPDKLKQGLIAVGGIAGGMAIFAITVSQLSKGGNLMAAAVAMGIISIAILEMTGIVAILGQFDPTKLTQGLISLGLILAGVLAFSILISQGINPINMMAAAASMGAMAGAILVISGAVIALGVVKFEVVKQGLISLGIAMAIMVASLLLLSNPSVLFGAAAMVIISSAILLLTPALIALSAVPVNKVGSALLYLAGVFAIVGIAGYVLAPLTLSIMGLGVAIALLGIGVLAIGAGLGLFAAGLAALSVAGSASISLLVSAIKAIIGLIPYLLSQVALGIVAMATIIIEGAPAIAAALVAVFSALITILSGEFPKLITVLFEFISGLLVELVKRVPEFVDAGMKIILGFLAGISSNIQTVVETLIQMVVNILNGIAEKLPDLIAAGANIIIAFLEGIGQEVPRVVDAAFQMIIDFINGLADSIRENTPLLLAAVGNLCTAFIDGVLEFFGISGGTSTEGQGWASSILQGIIDGLGAGISGVVGAIQNVGQSLISGFKDLFNINSPSKVMKELGGNIVDGLDEGISNSNIDAVKATKDIVQKMIDVVTNALPIFKKHGQLIVESISIGVKNKIGFILKGLNDLLTGMLNAITTSLPLFKNKTFEIMDQIIAGLTNSVKIAIIGDSTNKIMNAIINKITNRLPDITARGQSVIDAFVLGLKNQTKLAEVTASATTIMNNVMAGLTSGNSKQKAITAGEAIGSGLIQGINNKAYAIISAGTTLAQNLIEAVKRYLGVSSPSKEFAKVGEFLDLGLIAGINNYSDLVVKSAEQLGKDSIDGLKSVMSQISDAVSTEINSDPVIRPVLDLTGVQSGANALNSMMGNQTYGLAVSKLNQDRSSLTGRQNGSNLFGEAGQLIKNEFNLYGVTIRSEADIDKIADQLYRKQEDAMRARGIKPAYA